MKAEKIDLVFLVGGYGTRIKKYLKGKPKPILKFKNYIFLDLLIRNFCRYDINKIYILAGYKGNVIKKKYHRKKINLVDIECIVEKIPLGTAGSLSQLKNKVTNDFIVINGDTYFDIDLSKVIKFPLKNNQIFMSLVNNTNYKSNSKLKSLSLKNKTVRYNIKSNLINAGIYKFKKSFLNIVKRKNISLETDLLPNYIKKKSVKGIFFKNFFLDIGTPKNYFLAQRNLIKHITKPAIFLDRDGTINRDKGYTYKTKDLKFLKGVIKGLKLITKKNFYIFIVTNQAGIAKGYFTIKQFENFQKFMKRKLINQKIFINDIEYSPFHPHGKLKKFKKRSNLRKPGNLMIKKLMTRWPIDSDKSFMIGDKKTDELCAKKSGINFFYAKNDFFSLVRKKINNY